MSSTIIAVIVSLLFAVILLGGFFVGFWRGFKRSTVNLIFSVVGVIVAFFVTPLITNAILGIEVEYEGSQVSLQNILLEMILSVGDLRQMISANKNLELLVVNLPGALCNVIMFILVTIAIEIVMYIIYKICNFTFLKGAKGGRLFGGLVGVAKAFIVTIIAFMPLAGLIGFANKMTTANDYNFVAVAQTETQQNSKDDKNSSLILDKLPEQAVIVIKGLENNFLTKCSSLFGLDNAMLDYYASAKVDGGRVKVRKEIEEVYQIADFGYQLSNQDLNKLDWTKVNYDKLVKAVDEFTKSELFNYVVSPTISDMIINYEKYSFFGENFEFEDIFIDIGQRLAEMQQTGSYFRNDILTMVNTFKTIGKSGIVNDVVAVEDKDEKTIINVLTTDKNIAVIEDGINKVFKINLIKDSISSVTQKVIDKLSLELDNIGVDSADISENGWKEIATSLTEILKDMSVIINEVDIGAVIDDPAILLDKEKNYDLNLILSKIGGMVDKVRENKLLQTEAGKPIVDKLLNDKNLKLPENSLIDNQGNCVEIRNYKQLLEFVSQSVEIVRDEDLYNTVINSTSSDEEIMDAVANILSKEGNEEILSQIILPLYQVEFTNKLIIDKIVENLSAELLDLSLLTNYDEWKSDLGYISNVFVTLNSKKVGEESYLKLVVNGEVEKIINNIDAEDIDNVFAPVLNAKSTASLKESLFNNIASQLSTLTNKDIVISTQGVSFSGEESQTQEICNILKKFVAINGNLDAGIENINRQALSDLLEAMKLNAYRTLNGKEEEGIFKGCYQALVESFEEAYTDTLAEIAKNAQLLEELGVTDLDIETLLNIDFDKLVGMIEDILAQA